MRFVYFGLPLGAAALEANGFALDAMVIHHDDSPGMRRVRRSAVRRGALVLVRPRLDDPGITHAIASVRADAILSWYFPRNIPAAILRAARVGAFGVHPSLLPRWRGPDPFFWAIRTGDRTTGVTLHRLDVEYDTGPIIEQRALEIAPNETGWTLARRIDRPSIALLIECARRLARGEPMEGRSQTGEESHARQPTEDDLRIRWTDDAASIERLVRAAAPSPGAWTTIGARDVIVLDAALVDAPRALKPGEAMATPRGVVVRAKDAGLLLATVDDDGRILRGVETTAVLAR